MGEQRTQKYIFRWKPDLIEVWPSIADTPEEVWAWAKKNLRGAFEKDGESVVRNGEVIPYENGKVRP